MSIVFPPLPPSFFEQCWVVTCYRHYCYSKSYKFSFLLVCTCAKIHDSSFGLSEKNTRQTYMTKCRFQFNFRRRLLTVHCYWSCVFRSTVIFSCCKRYLVIHSLFPSFFLSPPPFFFLIFFIVNMLIAYTNLFSF